MVTLILFTLRLRFFLLKRKVKGCYFIWLKTKPTPFLHCQRRTAVYCYIDLYIGLRFFARFLNLPRFLHLVIFSFLFLTTTSFRLLQAIETHRDTAMIDQAIIFYITSVWLFKKLPNGQYVYIYDNCSGKKFWWMNLYLFASSLSLSYQDWYES